MRGRHAEKKYNKYLAAVTGVVLAGALAGSLGLAPGGGSEDPATDKTRSAATAAYRAEKPSQQKAAERQAKQSEPSVSCTASTAKARQYPNGRIPAEKLCPLPQRGEALRADAAKAFYELNAAYKERFGKDVCLRNSYRTFAKQKQLYESMPSGMAARPGRSKHGSGIAADFCGGVQDEGSAQYKWMLANSEKYDWIHPDWAFSSPFEPWHWEFDVGQND